MAKKNEAMAILEHLALEANRKQYPNMPDVYRPRFKYSDKTANGLTKCIVDFLRFRGHQAERIAVTGRYVDQTKVVSDCLGRHRRIGSGKWIKPSMQVGTADISATVKGIGIKIEVKIGADRQSESQAAYQRGIEKAGGVYYIARTFIDFLQWYELTTIQLNLGKTPLSIGWRKLDADTI